MPAILCMSLLVRDYLDWEYPKICRSLTPFSWEKPKLFKAKRYCQDVLGWTEDEASIE